MVSLTNWARSHVAVAVDKGGADVGGAEVEVAAIVFVGGTNGSVGVLNGVD